MQKYPSDQENHDADPHTHGVMTLCAIKWTQKVLTSVPEPKLFSSVPVPTPAPRGSKSQLRFRLQINSIRYLDNYLFKLEYQYFFTWIDEYFTQIGLNL